MLLTPRSLFFNKNISPTQLKASITVNAGCPGHLIAAFSCVGETKSQGFELLTFNKWFLEDEELASEYKLFMTNMIVAAMDYFKDTKRKRGLYKLCDFP